MAGARALWVANGMKREQFGKPIVAIVNSFTQFVPGHTHLHEIGQMVKAEIEKMGCYAAEFNTIAIDDGIAMGHDGMLYSLPSRDIIADSVEYMVNAHKADAMICISNCDKITPGMLMASMRLNIPTVFVSGGPMEAHKINGENADLITAMIKGADTSVSDEEMAKIEACACPGCGSCSGRFTAMGGSSNTVLHLLAVANEAGVDFKMADIDALSRKVPCLCKLAPNTQKYSIQECNRAGGILNILGELAKAGLLDTSCRRVNGRTLGEDIAKYSITSGQVDDEAQRIYSSAPGGVFSNKMGSQSKVYDTLDTDRATGCIRDVEHAYSKDGGLAVLFGNIAQDGCVVKTAGVDESIWKFTGPAKVFDHEGPKGGPGMQEMLYPTSYLKSRHLGKECALITDGRFSGGTSGLSIGHISPEAAAGGNIGKIVDGDIIEIDIPNRSINVKLSEAELAARPQRPMTRKRVVPKSLKAYASMVSSADKGGVRMID